MQTLAEPLPLLFLDTETYSATPIANGTHAYAEDSEVIMWQWAVNDGPVHVADELPAEPEAHLQAAGRGQMTIVCQNSGFDRDQEG